MEIRPVTSSAATFTDPQMNASLSQWRFRTLERDTHRAASERWLGLLQSMMPRGISTQSAGSQAGRQAFSCESETLWLANMRAPREASTDTQMARASNEFEDPDIECVRSFRGPKADLYQTGMSTIPLPSGGEHASSWRPQWLQLCRMHMRSTATPQPDLFSSVMQELRPLLVDHQRTCGVVSSWAIDTGAQTIVLASIHASPEALEASWWAGRQNEALRTTVERLAIYTEIISGPVVDLDQLAKGGSGAHEPVSITESIN